MLERTHWSRWIAALYQWRKCVTGCADAFAATRNFRATRRHLTAELGFGTGLAFLSAWADFRANAPADAQLDWVSVESAPLDAATIQRALASNETPAVGNSRVDQLITPSTAPLLAELLRALPPRIRGIHRRAFDGGRVRLTLLYGNVLELLPVTDFIADAWQLDGFAPKRNPEMWCVETLAQVVAHARVGTTVAGRFAPQEVQEILKSLGFELHAASTNSPSHPPHVAPTPLFGTLARVPEKRTFRQLPRWFSMPHPVTAVDTHQPPIHTTTTGAVKTADTAITPITAVVVGAGLAGASAARALAERGIPVTIIDAGCVAGRASAAPRAVLAPYLASWQSPQTRVVAQSFMLARAVMERVGAPLIPCGLLHPVNSDDEWGYEQSIAEWGWPIELLRLIGAEEATSVAGTSLSNTTNPEGALFVRDAATTRPAETVRALLTHPTITIHEHAPVARLRHTDDGWHVDTEDGRTFDTNIVVIATAGIPAAALPDMPEALASDALPSIPFNATRGQLSTLAFDEAFSGANAVPFTIVSANGFAMPPVDGALCAGATYERERLTVGPTPHDDAVNLGHIERLLPALAMCTPNRRGAWAGIRTSVNDHCPVIGPVVADAQFRESFARLPHGPFAAAWPEAPLLPGLFVTLAHGSRGTSTVFLAAELIADMVCGTPRCITDDLLPAVLPQRFLVRELRVGTRE
ncbi:MAG: FAD-dependent 5-carboxymethylaminomethyl-2-thiouridine(34) oxidoreductase MnmC [Planctomycetota bacterium]